MAWSEVIKCHSINRMPNGPQVSVSITFDVCVCVGVCPKIKGNIFQIYCLVRNMWVYDVQLQTIQIRLGIILLKRQPSNCSKLIYSCFITSARAHTALGSFVLPKWMKDSRRKKEARKQLLTHHDSSSSNSSSGWHNFVYEFCLSDSPFFFLFCGQRRRRRFAWLFYVFFSTWFLSRDSLV